MEEGNGVQKETEEWMEDKGKEKVKVTEVEVGGKVIVVEDGSEDGVGEETLDVE